MNRFVPYEGKKPYVFISYARGDTEVMLNAMNLLRAKNYRLWYDEGIPGGTDWPAYIAEHLKNSAAALFFLSAKSFVSPNCLNEMAEASNSSIKTLCIPLDATAALICNAIRENRELTENELETIVAETESYAARRKSKVKLPTAADWLKALKNIEFIEISGPEEIPETIFKSGILKDSMIGDYGEDDNGGNGSGLNKWIIYIIICILLLGGLVYGAYKISTERQTETIVVQTPAPATPKPTIDPNTIPGINSYLEFPETDTQQERAVRQMSGISEGRIEDSALRDITQLHFCGKTLVLSADKIKCKDGRWYAGTTPVAKGEISDLSIIKKMYYLESLSLVYQNIHSIADLAELQLLSVLDVSGNPVSEINLEKGFERLETLNISHTGIKRLPPKEASPKSLKTICVSAEMLPMEIPDGTAYEVVLVK